MQAFVTGATGFLGIHLLRELSAEGWEIIALRRPTSDLTDVQGIPGVRFVVGDVTDIQSLRDAMPEGADAVFHAAGLVSVLDPKDEHLRYEVNQIGTRNVVETALGKHAKRFIYTSTVLTYNFHTGKRVTEEAGPNTDTHEIYGHSKYLAELEVDRGVSQGLDAVFLHPSAVFGAYDKGSWSTMFREIQRGLPLPLAPPGGGSVCHMAPVAKAHVSAFHRGGRGEHYILGGPDATWLEVGQTIAKILNRPLPRYVVPVWLFRLYGRAEYAISKLLGRKPTFTPQVADVLCDTVFSDTSKAIRELGYQPSSLEEMLLDCYRWMVDVGQLPPPSKA